MSAAARLFELYAPIRDLEAAEAVLGWDQETYMPAAGQNGRGHVLGTLAQEKHRLQSDNAFADAIEACADEAEDGSELAAQVREARRLHDRAVKVPADLARALALATSQGLASWQQARRESDFSIFQADLAHLIDLVRQQGTALAAGGRPYDALLDLYEPGSTEEALAPLFTELRQALAPMVQAIADSGRTIDESPAQGAFDVDAQRAFGEEIAAAIGFDFSAGRLDLAAHPFCTGFHPRDVRLTWRYQENDLRPALYGIMHEAGHGLYEQGLPEAWQRTPLGAAAGLGIHESQSRLWENLVGRSLSFWRWAMPRFHAHFPERAEVSAEQMHPAVNVVRPSLIRVEADEMTYNLHVAARFEVERQLMDGQVEVGDLPELWNQTYQELLGVRPPDDAVGVLQDIHWGMGAFGYFPTYTLGNLYNAQLFETAVEDLGDLDEAFAQGEFSPLLDWLRDRIHRHGSCFNAGELIQRATGKQPGTAAFLRRIRRIATEVHGIQGISV